MMLRFLHWLVERLPVFRRGHLYHADGTFYMRRWKVFETRWLSCRLHHLATADYDRHFHDHPWPFVSVLLHGWYVEHRPWSVVPCFRHDDGFEDPREVVRKRGSVAFRRAQDRHRVAQVVPDTYSLFIYFGKAQSWGFYTPAGKVHWEDYESVHAAGVIEGRPDGGAE